MYSSDDIVLDRHLSAAEISAQVNFEIIELLYQQARPALLVNSTVGILIGCGFWGVVAHWKVMLWCALVAVAWTCSALVVWAHRRAQVTVHTTERWATLREVETALNGGSYGLMAILLFPGSPLLYQCVISIVICGFVAGAIPVNSVRFRTYLVYFVPLFCPLTLQLVLQGGAFFYMGLAGIPFAISMLTTARFLSQSTTASLRLKYEKTALAFNLARETEQRKRVEEEYQLQKQIADLSVSLQMRNQELTDTLKRAEELSRLKSIFLANMSHEIRTPLNTIINVPKALLRNFDQALYIRCTGCEQMFEPDPDDTFDPQVPCPGCGETALVTEARNRYTGDPERIFRSLHSVQQCGTQLLSVLNDILDYSKIEAGKMVVRIDQVPVGKLFFELGEVLHPMADRRAIRLTFQEVDPSSCVQADPVKITQIFTNLISNAIKFSEDGSAVEVGVTLGEEDCLFTVRDHGIGIAPEDQGLLFQAFRQVDGGHTRKYDGTGLGLAISKNLVDLHHGAIWFESALGQGTTFYVRLPRT